MDLSWNINVTDYLIQQVTNNFKLTLKSLNLAGCPVTDNSFIPDTYDLPPTSLDEPKFFTQLIKLDLSTLP